MGPAENSREHHSWGAFKIPGSPGRNPDGAFILPLPQGPAQAVAAAGTHLVAVVVHGDQAVDVEDVAASGQLAHQVRLDRRLRILVAGGGCEALHADGAVLQGGRGQSREAISAHPARQAPAPRRWFPRDRRSGELSPPLSWKAHGPRYMDLWESKERFYLALHNRKILEIIPGISTC